MDIKEADTANTSLFARQAQGYTAHQVLDLLGSVLMATDSPQVAFVRREDDGFSLHTMRHGRLQKWLVCSEGIAEMPL